MKTPIEPWGTDRAESAPEALLTVLHRTSPVPGWFFLSSIGRLETPREPDIDPGGVVNEKSQEKSQGQAQKIYQ